MERTKLDRPALLRVAEANARFRRGQPGGQWPQPNHNRPDVSFPFSASASTRIVTIWPIA